MSAALFNYPILMAGDILLYEADAVPIGDDQRQHPELARDIAERFNTRFGETFKVPEGIYPEIGARIMDLQEPTDKMGKTDSSEQGKVLMLDDPEVVRKKFKTAVTDSGDRGAARPEEKAGRLEPDRDHGRGDGQLDRRGRVAIQRRGLREVQGGRGEAVVEVLVPIQDRYRALRADEDELRRLLAVGADKAREASAPTLEAIYDRMGFVRP